MMRLTKLAPSDAPKPVTSGRANLLRHVPRAHRADAFMIQISRALDCLSLQRRSSVPVLTSEFKGATVAWSGFGELEEGVALMRQVKVGRRRDAYWLVGMS